MSHFWGGWKYLERRFSSRSASRTSKLTQIKPDKHFSLRCFSTEENEWKCIRINSVIASLMNGIILKSNYSTFVKDPLEQPQVPREVPLWFLFSVCLILGQQLVATRNKDLQRASDASAHAAIALSYPLCLSSFIPARCVLRFYSGIKMDNGRTSPLLRMKHCLCPAESTVLTPIVACWPILCQYMWLWYVRNESGTKRRRLIERQYKEFMLFSNMLLIITLFFSACG